MPFGYSVSSKLISRCYDCSSSPGASLGLDFRGYDDGSPQLHIGIEECGELRRAGGRWHRGDVGKPLPDLAVSKRFGGVVVKLSYDVGRGSGRHVKAIP